MGVLDHIVPLQAFFLTLAQRPSCVLKQKAIRADMYVTASVAAASLREVAAEFSDTTGVNERGPFSYFSFATSARIVVTHGARRVGRVLTGILEGKEAGRVLTFTGTTSLMRRERAARTVLMA